MNTEKTVPAQGFSPQAAVLNLPIRSGVMPRAQKVVLYGVEGIGKSTLAAAMAPLAAPGGRALFLDTEDGSSRLDVDRIRIRSRAMVAEACSQLVQAARGGERPYALVVLDTMDWVYELAAAEACEELKVSSLAKLEFGKGFALAKDKTIEVLRWLDALVAKGVSVCVVAHARVNHMQTPGLPEYDQFGLKIGGNGKAALEAADRVREWADAVLFANYDAVVTDDKKVRGGAQRVLYAERCQAWEAKNRHGLPFSMAMRAELLAPIFAAAAEAVAPPAADAPGTPAEVPPAPDAPDAPEEPAANSPKDLGFDHELVADEDALLVEYFVHVNLLKPGQSLEDLPAQVKAALAARRAGALEKARAWKGGLA